MVVRVYVDAVDRADLDADIATDAPLGIHHVGALTRREELDRFRRTGPPAEAAVDTGPQVDADDGSHVAQL